MWVNDLVITFDFILSSFVKTLHVEKCSDRFAGRLLVCPHFVISHLSCSMTNQQSGMCAQSLRCPHEGTLGPQPPNERTAKTLIRLGWSESSLGAQFILLVLSCCGSYYYSSTWCQRGGLLSVFVAASWDFFHWFPLWNSHLSTNYNYGAYAFPIRRILLK